MGISPDLSLNIYSRDGGAYFNVYHQRALSCFFLFFKVLPQIYLIWDKKEREFLIVFFHSAANIVQNESHLREKSPCENVVRKHKKRNIHSYNKVVAVFKECTKKIKPIIVNNNFYI